VTGVEVEIIGDVLGGITSRLVSLDRLAGTAGVHDDADDYPGGTSVLVVAATQEFGGGDNPPRPFERPYFDSRGAKEMGDAAADAVGKVIDGAAPTTVPKAAADVGAAGVREWIERGLAYPAGGDSSTPLTSRTGHLVSQIKAKVRSE